MQSEWLNIVVLSDSHGKFNFLKVPDGDILIHCGDWSNLGKVEECIKFNNWLKEQPHKYKFYIPGNHEIGFEKQPGLSESLITEAENIHGKVVNVEGLKIFGCSYTLPFMNWAYMRTENELENYFSNAPSDIDVLITHGPPKGVLDETIQGTSTGSQALLEYTKKIKPQYHFFGHIHEAAGMDIFTSCKTIYVNVAVLNERYNPASQPIRLPVQTNHKETYGNK